MQHVQGYSGSHWMPPSGDYSLHIAPAAAKATANKPTMYHVPTLMAISVVIAMRWYYTARIARWRRSRAFIKATKRRHRASTRCCGYRNAAIWLDVLGAMAILQRGHNFYIGV